MELKLTFRCINHQLLQKGLFRKLFPRPVYHCVYHPVGEEKIKGSGDGEGNQREKKEKKKNIWEKYNFWHYQIKNII